MRSCENGSSVSLMPNGNVDEGIGKFERAKCGAPPIAVTKLETCARCSISSTATPAILRFHVRTASSSGSVKPPSFKSLFSEYPAYRYTQARLCSSSEARVRRYSSSSRVSTGATFAIASVRNDGPKTALIASPPVDSLGSPSGGRESYLKDNTRRNALEKMKGFLNRTAT